MIESVKGRFAGLGFVGPALHLKLNRWEARSGTITELGKRIAEEVVVVVIPKHEMPEKGLADLVDEARNTVDAFEGYAGTRNEANLSAQSEALAKLSTFLRSLEGE